MQITDKYEQILLKEISEFPRDKLPLLVKLVKFARAELFSDKNDIKIQDDENSPLKTIMGSFKGYLSTTSDFIKRKKEEKTLEL